MTTLARSYRSVLRELHRTAIQPRPKRNVAIFSMIRELYDEQRAASGNQAPSEQFVRDMESTSEFLRAGRLHSELLIRYNPLHDMSPEERVHATARRVGLESPEKYAKQENE